MYCMKYSVWCHQAEHIFAGQNLKLLSGFNKVAEACTVCCTRHFLLVLHHPGIQKIAYGLNSILQCVRKGCHVTALLARQAVAIISSTRPSCGRYETSQQGS